MTIWTGILIAVTAVATGVALWIVIDARKSNFQPYWPVRIKLWLAGFFVTWGIGWTYTGGDFTEAIWLKILISIIGGLLWSVRLVGFLKVPSDTSESIGSKEP